MSDNTSSGDSFDYNEIGNDDPLANSLAADGMPPDDPIPSQLPVYKAMPDSRVPVSSKRGAVWRSRRDTCKKAMGDLIDAWNECIRYYSHDQADHRDGSDMRVSGNRYVATQLNDLHSSTENVVFANVNAQVPELYAKNPRITCTAQPGADPQAREAGDDFARAVEKLVNVLFGMKDAPGINLKPKAKRNVLVALLTNLAWFEVGYVKKEQGSDQALADLQELSQNLQKAKDQEEIEEIEQALRALEQKIEFLQPAGPYVRIRAPHQVLVDPNSNNRDLTDAQWIMIEDMLPTDYINAVYGIERGDMQPTAEGEENEGGDNEEVVSIYEPTHILNGGGDGTGNADGSDDSFSLFTKDRNGYNAYGFDSQETFDKAKRTRVWYVWDKTTRRLEMYADNDWSWPIWVWDDPYNLQGFFPLTPMAFHDNPVAVYAKGEVSYYLDQQDQINEINDERRRALLWARRNIFYDLDSGLTQDDVDNVLSGPKASAVGIKVPDGKKPNDMLFSIPPPSMNFQQLFDKKDLYASIDRIASTNEVERGGQFKTNTTNKAIDYYSTMGNMRMDMRLDAIEDAIGDVGWKVAQLCLRFMEPQTVQDLIGIDVSQFWQPLDNLRDFSKISLTVVGGSTQKVSSQAKKQEAVQVGQVMAQFAKAAPAAVLKATLNLMASAFDDMQITKEDWLAIEAEVERTLVAGQGGAPGVGQPPGPPGAPQPGGGAGGPPADPMRSAVMVTQLLSQLPPQVLKSIGIALAQGVPPQAILQQMLQASGAPQGLPDDGAANGSPPPPQMRPNGAMQ